MGRKKLKLKSVLLAAVSLDGRITRGSKEGSQWTSKEDKQWFQKKLDEFDVVIMGRKTFNAIKHPLTPRRRIVFSRASSVIPLKKGIQGVIPFHGSAIKLRSFLHQRGWNRIAVLGGTQIYDWFLKRNLIAEIFLTLEPVILGSGKPLSSQFLNPLRRFRLLSIKRLNSRRTLLLHYKVD